MDTLGARSSDGIFVTTSNVNPIVQVVTWLLLAVAALLLSFRMLTRFFLKANRKLGIEEIFIVTAFVFDIGQSVTLLVPEGRIFGKDRDLISAKELRAGLKAQYAGDMLFIAAMCFAKLSVCASFLALSPDRIHRRITFCLEAIVIAWALSAIIGLALRCGTHGPWDNGNSCISEPAFLKYVAISNAITDFTLMLLPVWIIYPLNMPVKTRLTIISFFAVRVLVIIAIIFQIIYLPRLYQPNFTRQAFPYFITVQVVQFASISAACVVYFWPFLRSLRSGHMWANNTTFQTQYTLSKLSTPRNGMSKASSRTAHSKSGAELIQITTENTVSSERVKGDVVTADHQYRNQW